jgi:hypothetical protein
LVKHWKVDALDLLQEAAKIAKARKSGEIATAAADVMDAMVNDGLVDPDTSTVYAIIMEELFASGAFRVEASMEELPDRLAHRLVH